MDRYALIELSTELVVNVAIWDGETEWAPEEGVIAIQSDSAQIGHSYVKGEFIAPPAPEDPPLTPEEILAVNEKTKVNLMAQASQAMTPLLVSLQLGNATDAETTSAQAWQAYCRALNLADLTIESPAWPVVPT
ncbi:tail fiber assembly protein [Pseudomonas umsongensis]|uniref:Tail fiber assembly protein n=1 Tax=Pseudomonas umsongensis TaxID=198618 RepID=A0AAE6ZT97_9PSED|nr:tail fiber assembly protein [Pseudomonas umsongensis]QJC78905.1 tail fiber assembly protein [Pseudomonas umsongensis]